MNKIPEAQHNKEIFENLEHWKKKPILHKIYADFYHLISRFINFRLEGKIIEIGSGIGNLKFVVPQAICTDIFPNPWLDQLENAYNLSFSTGSVSNIILFDVFHHLEYPGSALNEFYRVLKKNGRVIIFDPYLSLLGYLVYGILHHEPVGSGKLSWFAPENVDPNTLGYYASQGNATKVFYKKRYNTFLTNWEIIEKKRISSISYVASGGYSKPQLYPTALYPAVKKIDKILGFLPWIFATRLLMVLQRR